MNQELTTARLRLTPCAPENFEATYRLWTDEAVRRFLFDDRAITVEEARAFLAASDATFAEEGYGLRLVCRRTAPREPIGFAGLLRSEAAAPHLIYGLHPNFWGGGFAAEAARAVLADAFRRLGLPAVAADVDEANAASVRVLVRLGMRRMRRALVAGRPLLFFRIEREEFFEAG